MNFRFLISCKTQKTVTFVHVKYEFMQWHCDEACTEAVSPSVWLISCIMPIHFGFVLTAVRWHSNNTSNSILLTVANNSIFSTRICRCSRSMYVWIVATILAHVSLSFSFPPYTFTVPIIQYHRNFFLIITIAIAEFNQQQQKNRTHTICLFVLNYTIIECDTGNKIMQTQCAPASRLPTHLTSLLLFNIEVFEYFWKKKNLLHSQIFRVNLIKI